MPVRFHSDKIIIASYLRGFTRFGGKTSYHLMNKDLDPVVVFAEPNVHKWYPINKVNHFWIPALIAIICDEMYRITMILTDIDTADINCWQVTCLPLWPHEGLSLVSNTVGTDGNAVTYRCNFLSHLRRPFSCELDIRQKNRLWPLCAWILFTSLQSYTSISTNTYHKIRKNETNIWAI